MEQDIRFCELDGRRIAYATVGEGPLLLFGGRWVTHLEEEWEEPRCARLLRGARPDAPRRPLRPARRRGSPTAVARIAPRRPSRRRGARRPCSTPAAATSRRSLFACSCAGLATARLASSAPERVDKIVFFGGYARATTSPRRRGGRSSTSSRMNWPLAAQMLAGLFVPHGSGDEIDCAQPLPAPCGRRRASPPPSSSSTSPPMPATSCRWSRRPRSCSTAEATARCRSAAGASSRRSLPNARFVPLGGDSHLPVDGRPARAPARARRLPRRRPARRGERRLAAQRTRDRGAAPRRRRPLEPGDRLRRSSSASTPCTATSRTSCASSATRLAPPPRRTRRAPATSSGGRRAPTAVPRYARALGVGRSRAVGSRGCRR